MNELYFISDNFLNVTYSIDMLRVKTYISHVYFSELEFRLTTRWHDFLNKKWESYDCREFQYNYTMNAGDSTIYIGFLHNNEKRNVLDETLGYNLTIEFNPNKVRNNKILDYIFSMSDNWFIKSCDIALDLPINILNVIYDKGLKRKYKIFGTGGDDKTIMIGEGQGRLKIYNKKRESNLFIVGDLTRVEVSTSFDDFPISMIKVLDVPDVFPSLYTNNHIFTLDDYKDKTLLACLYAVQSGFPINDLSRVYKKKVKNMIEGGSRIKFDTKVATKVLRKTLFNYFLKVNKFS